MNDKIYISIDGKKIEAKGEVLDQILKDQEDEAERLRLIEAAEKEKAEKKESATNKLKALGLTDSEVEALLG
jgi:predicted DNA binding protein